MPQQLIYTSAPRGVVAGRAGHCTVARSATMRDALMLQLEKLSYYQHLSLSGGQERPIYCSRLVDIRGSRYHVLSRIQDAGLDFTGRTNFLAHHLVFAPEEVRQFASPPIILREWTGWEKSWAKDPELFDNENWSSLTGLPGNTVVPATHWQELTGDAINGYGLLEVRASIALRVDGLVEEQILTLFAESLELLELRDQRRDFRASAWQYTFTTSMQEQDNPADFRWRCLHSDNPASNRFAGPDSRGLGDIRAARVTGEETILARLGRQAPRFVSPPQDITGEEGQIARLQAKAEGMPAPAYQWFSMDRAGNRKAIVDAVSGELQVSNPPVGVTRYVVRAVNSEGEVTSDVVTLSVEQKARIAKVRPAAGTPVSANTPHVKSENEIEQQRRRLEADQAEAFFLKRIQRRKIMIGCVAGLGLALVAALVWWRFGSTTHQEATPKATVDKNLPKVQNSNPQPQPLAQFKTDNRPAQAPPDTVDSTSPIGEPLSDSITGPPAPWKSRRIGKIFPPTAAAADKNDFIIHGAGDNINGRADNFFFLRRPATNSMDFVARLKVADRLNASRHGIMIRGSDSADAAFAFVGLSQSSIFWLHRDGDSQTCQFMTQPIPKFPVFLKLRRGTNSVSGAFSVDGSNWVWLGTNEITMSEQNYLVGFAVSAGNNVNSALAKFDDVKIAEGAVGAEHQ